MKPGKPLPKNWLRAREAAHRVSYRRERLDGGWTILHVLSGLEVVGRIVRAPNEGKYRYFEGHDNHVAYTLESASLDELQRKIAADLAQRRG